jgi:hypothetical protein
MAMTMPMMATTIMISMSVKARLKDVECGAWSVERET